MFRLLKSLLKSKRQSSIHASAFQKGTADLWGSSARFSVLYFSLLSCAHSEGIDFWSGEKRFSSQTNSLSSWSCVCVPHLRTGDFIFLVTVWRGVLGASRTSRSLSVVPKYRVGSGLPHLRDLSRRSCVPSLSFISRGSPCSLSPGL